MHRLPEVCTGVCTRGAFAAPPAHMNRMVERNRSVHAGRNGRSWDRTSKRGYAA
jgi:hypothetical protein